MTANGSSSSVTSPQAEAGLHLDLLASGRLPTLPTAFLEQRDLDLLEPLRFQGTGRVEPLLERRPPAVDRTRLAAALTTANAAYGHPEAERLAERLADPATRVVVTGQQPGLYGGPLLSLTKMCAAVRWAEAIEAAGQPAVAIFWVATEDHDWAEVAQATVLTRKGPESFDLGTDPAPLLPLGMRTLGDRLEPLEEEIRQAAGHAAGVELAKRWYRPDARVGEAFSRLMVHLLGKRAPLLFDAMLPEVKELEKPWLRRFVEQRAEIDRAYSAADAEVLERGYSLQVKPQPGVSPLFLLRGQERRRIAWSDDGESYVLRGSDEPPRPVAELHQILEDNPSVISPGVLARPAVQDAVLGTTLQVMGPSELAYMTQVRAVYPVLGIDPPWTSLRPQAMILEPRQVGYLDELGVSLEELLDTAKHGSGGLDQLLTAKLGADLVGPTKGRVEELLNELRQPILDLDPSLERPWRKTRDQIGRNLDQLAGKVAAAVARRHQVWNRRLEQICQTCLPNGTLQERLLTVIHFVNRFGVEFADELCSGLELEPRLLNVIQISAGRPAEPRQDS